LAENKMKMEQLNEKEKINKPGSIS
jgi:hypothetical protein